MKLSPIDADFFVDWHGRLIIYVGHRLEMITKSIRSMAQWNSDTPDPVVEVRNAVYDHIDLLDEFIEAHRRELSDEAAEIIGSWRHFVRGRFLLLRQLKKHAIFLPMERSDIAYGVLALRNTFEEQVLHIPCWWKPFCCLSGMSSCMTVFSSATGSPSEAAFAGE